MRAVRYHEKGPPEVLKVEEVPTPTPGDGEVLMRIEAVSVGFAEVHRRAGGYYPGPPIALPHTPGGAAAGTVEAVGPGVDPSLKGKRVYGGIRTGGYAEYGLADANRLRILTDNFSSIDAVAILSEAETTGMILKGRAKLQPGETVFVPAATGGIGFLALQLAQLWGAGRVFGGASSEAKRKLVAGFGAIPIDYTKEDWSKDVIAQNGDAGVDLGLEVTGGKTFYETLNAVRPGGRIINYGNVSDTDAPVNPRALLRRNQTLIGFHTGLSMQSGIFLDERAAVRKDIEAFIAAGKLKPLIGGVFTLDEAPAAHHALENRSANGKVVIAPNGK